MTVLRTLMLKSDATDEGPSRVNALAARNIPLMRKGSKHTTATTATSMCAISRHAPSQAPANSHRPLTPAEVKRREQLAAYLDTCSEDELIEEVLQPMFRQLGFHRITAAGLKNTERAVLSPAERPRKADDLKYLVPRWPDWTRSCAHRRPFLSSRRKQEPPRLFSGLLVGAINETYVIGKRRLFAAMLTMRSKPRSGPPSVEVAIERDYRAMGRQREFSFAYAHEHFRGGMRNTFPPLLDIPAEMRTALLDLERNAARPASPKEGRDEIKSLAEDAYKSGRDPLAEIG